MRTLLTLLLGLLCLRGMAQTGVAVAELAQVDESVQQFMRRWDILGASVAVAKDGQLVYSRAFGYADAGRTTLLQPHHLLRVASISKPVTALAIMKLVEEGQLRLTGKVFGPDGYLSGAAYSREIRDPRLYSITVQHLLEHTAGWDRSLGCDGQSSCDPIDFPTHVARVMRVPNPVGDTTLIRYMLRQGLNYAPGTHFAYSNTGYLVLGKVLEAVTRQPYETWVRQHLLAPSGVLEARLGRSLPASRDERESAYDSRYRRVSCFAPAQRVPAADGGFHLEAMNAHGGWLFSARDLVRLTLAADGFSTRPDLVSAATVQSMTQPSAAAGWYAKGWMVHGDTWWHSGLLDGTASLLTRTPDGYTWAILLNTGSGLPQFWRELQALGRSWVSETRHWPAHNLFAPELNAALLRVSATDSAHAQLSWANGSGTHRLLLLRAGQPGTAFPLDGTPYPPASVLPDGSLIVANGQASAALLPQLNPRLTYYARVVEYRQDSTTGQRPVYALEGNPQLVLRPTDLPLVPQLGLHLRPASGQASGATDSYPYQLTSLPGALVQTSTLAPDRSVPVRPLSPRLLFPRARRQSREEALHHAEE